MQVIVIDKGEISESGTHDELLRKAGVYKKLVLRQRTAGAIVDTLVNGPTTSIGDDQELIDLNIDNQDLAE